MVIVKIICIKYWIGNHSVVINLDIIYKPGHGALIVYILFGYMYTLYKTILDQCIRSNQSGSTESVFI
jgi:hypothetical protein